MNEKSLVSKHYPLDHWCLDNQQLTKYRVVYFVGPDTGLFWIRNILKVVEKLYCKLSLKYFIERSKLSQLPGIINMIIQFGNNVEKSNCQLTENENVLNCLEAPWFLTCLVVATVLTSGSAPVMTAAATQRVTRGAAGDNHPQESWQAAGDLMPLI